MCQFDGFSKSHKFHGVSDTEAYKQFGNSVVVPVATLLAKALVDQLKSLKSKTYYYQKKYCLI